jgi:trehalose 6-phosphate phosphatase
MRKTRQPPVAQAAWAYFLDVDGTLLDIAETPSAVEVDAALLALIERLHQGCDGAVALISGRALSDLDERLGSLRLPMAGQHGLERRDVAGRLWLHAPPPEAKCAIKAALAPLIERHPGLYLEDKGLTLALHYRRAR